MMRIEKAQYIIEAGIISIHPCNLGKDDGSIYWMSDEEIDMIYDDTIKAQEAKEATSTNESESKEEQTMNTNTKEIRFEIREIDAWNYGEEEGWIWNTSYLMGEMTTKAQNERKAFTSWLKNHCGISFKNNRTLIEYDGDCYTIIDRKTKEPLFIAIPQY